VSDVTYKHSKLGQADLVFGFRSEFTRMHAGLQVSTCGGYGCATLVNTQTHTQGERHTAFDSLYY